MTVPRSAARIQLDWLCSLSGAPSPEEIEAHLAMPDKTSGPGSGFADELFGVAALLRDGVVESETSECIHVRVRGDRDMLLRVQIDPLSGRIFLVDVFDAATAALSQPERAARLFDQAASTYEESASGLAYYWDRAKSWLAENVSGTAVLYDVGCGPGQLTDDLPASVRVFGTDISPNMVAAAATRRPDGTFIVHDYHEPLPLEWPQADALIAVGCLDFAQDLGVVLRHFFAACTKRAHLLISVPRPAEPDAPTTTTFPIFDLVMTTHDDNYVRELVETAGFTVEQMLPIDGYAAPGVGLVNYGLWELRK